MRAIASAAALPLLPISPDGALAEIFELGLRVRAEIPPAGTARSLGTLTTAQSQLVTTLAEIILPETDTPGATLARVNEFIDLLLTDWFAEDDRDAFLAGLAAVDERAQNLYGAVLVVCTAAQQTELVGILDAELAGVAAAESAPGAHGGAAGVIAPPPEGAAQDGTQRARDLFFYEMKRWTLTGYFTSEAGMKELGYEAWPGRWDPCVEIPSDEHGAVAAQDAARR